MTKTQHTQHSTGCYIGMMSGTSLDAIDAVICRFEPHFEMLANHSIDMPADLRASLLALCTANVDPNLSELDQFGKLSVDYARLCHQVVQALLNKTNLTASTICAIGCHGQTVRHRPELGFSLQLLDANFLAEATGICVVSDFRRRDMAVGGQGAPLVPAFHYALFAHHHELRIMLNLGGIANITVLPPINTHHTDHTHASDKNNATNHVIGFDTGPANLLLDAWCNTHTGQPYDNNGDWAKSGEIISPLLTQLLQHPFFAKPTPKSTGREDFHLVWLTQALEKFDQTHTHLDYSAADVQATLVELTAISVADAIKQTLPQPNHVGGQLFACGGGAYNQYLLTRLAHHLPNLTVTTTASLGLSPTWVEAIAFAWLARQNLLGKTGNLPNVTGAKKNVVLGVQTPH